MVDLTVPYLLLGLGVVAGLFSMMLPPSAVVALAFTGVPAAGVALAMALC